MGNWQYYVPGGLLLIDGKTGRGIAATDPAGMIPVSDLVDKYENDLIASLKSVWPTGKLTVYVLDQTYDNPISDFEVRFTDADGQSFVLVSDSEGECNLFLKPGVYTVAGNASDWGGTPVTVNVAKADREYDATIYVEDQEPDPEEGDPEEPEEA